MPKLKLAARILVLLFLTTTLLGISLLVIQGQVPTKAPKSDRDGLIKAIYISYLLPLRGIMTSDLWENLRQQARQIGEQNKPDQELQMLTLLIEGELSRTAKQLDVARGKFQGANGAAPEDSLPYLGLAEVALDEGQSDHAAVMLFVAENQVSKTVPAAFQHLCYFRVGELYGRAGKMTQAIQAYELAVTERPKWGLGQRTLARAYLSVNEPAKALDHVQKAIAVEPKEPSNYSLSGEAQDSLGRPSLAIQAFQKAVDLDPGNPLYHYQLGHEYEGQGNKTQALRSYLAAKNLVERGQFPRDVTERLDEAIARVQK